MIFLLILSNYTHNNIEIQNKKRKFNNYLAAALLIDIIISTLVTFIILLCIYQNNDCDHNRIFISSCYNYIKTNISIISWNCNNEACGKYYITDNIYLCKIDELYFTQDNINNYPIGLNFSGFYNNNNNYKCVIQNTVNTHLKKETKNIIFYKYATFIGLPYFIFSISYIYYANYIYYKYYNEFHNNELL